LTGTPSINPLAAATGLTTVITMNAERSKASLVTVGDINPSSHRGIGLCVDLIRSTDTQSDFMPDRRRGTDRTAATESNSLRHQPNARTENAILLTLAQI
jgi:hypothetical protein